MKRTSLILLCMMMIITTTTFSVNAANVPFRDIGNLSRETQERVRVLYQNGIVEGTSSTEFSPNSYYTRSMFVTMLGRMMHIDTREYNYSSFRDIPNGRWDTPYVSWAAENDIVNGIGDGKFDPTGIITMEQYCAIICRCMDQYWMAFASSANTKWPPTISNLRDASSYARDNIKLMVELGLTDWSDYNRSSNTIRINPKQKLNRAWIADYFGLFYIALWGYDGYTTPSVYHQINNNSVLRTWVDGLWADGEDYVPIENEYNEPAIWIK